MRREGGEVGRGGWAVYLARHGDGCSEREVVGGVGREVYKVVVDVLVVFDEGKRGAERGRSWEVGEVDGVLANNRAAGTM